MRIGAYQSARAQQNPAKITGHHHYDVGQPLLLQHIEHRHPGCTLWLSVVRIAPGLPFPQDIGINVVGSIPVRRLFLIDERHSFLFGARRPDVPDEPGAPFGEFVRSVRTDRCIFDHRLSPNRIRGGQMPHPADDLKWFGDTKNWRWNPSPAPGTHAGIHGTASGRTMDWMHTSYFSSEVSVNAITSSSTSFLAFSSMPSLSCTFFLALRQ